MVGNMNKDYTLVKRVVLIVMVPFVLFQIYQYPHKYDHVLPCYEVELETGQILETDVMGISGVIANKVFGKSEFWGNISIGEKKLQVSYRNPIVLAEKDNPSFMLHQEEENKPYGMFGYIYSDSSLSQLIIMKFNEKNGSQQFGSGTGSMIIGTNSNQEDIIKNVNELLRDTRHNSHVILH